VHVVFVLEFLMFDGDGKRVIERMTYRAKTVNAAQNHAGTVLKTGFFQGRRADLGEVKDKMGNVLGVVPV
jgi:hypothetical protein